VAVGASQIYWSSLGDEAGSGAIIVAGLNGSRPRPVVTGLDQPAGAAAGAIDLYWSATADGTIGQADLDGAGPHPVVTGQATPRWVAVNPAAGLPRAVSRARRPSAGPGQPPGGSVPRRV
jgi:hypothetical protein